MSWKDKLDKKLDKQAEKEAARMERAYQKSQEKEKKKLEGHKRRFKCHICGKTSNGPSTSTNEPDSGAHVTSYTFWNTPTGLSKCRKCKRWTCETHIHRQICKKCAEGRTIRFLGINFDL